MIISKRVQFCETVRTNVGRVGVRGSVRQAHLNICKSVIRVLDAFAGVCLTSKMMASWEKYLTTVQFHNKGIFSTFGDICGIQMEVTVVRGSDSCHFCRNPVACDSLLPVELLDRQNDLNALLALTEQLKSETIELVQVRRKLHTSQTAVCIIVPIS